MGQFHLTVYVSNSRFAHIATEAMLDRAPITMNGEFDDEIRTVTGFVQSIEADANAMPRRWRITILEDQRHSERVVSFLRRSRLESPCECEGQLAPPLQSKSHRQRSRLPQHRCRPRGQPPGPSAYRQPVELWTALRPAHNSTGSTPKKAA